MSEKQSPSRAEVLKALRQKHADTVEETREALKNQQQVRRMINEQLKDEAKTVPATAEAIGLPASEVLWHVMAMKKYGLIVETGLDGEYYTYQVAKESSG
jgi:predicted transcriptional regulator